MAGLTDQQSKALQLDKHISVTANAGSGKTRVLVERYVAAVRDGIPVGQILCLTFTEKAALELRQKIAERISLEYRTARNNGGKHAAVLADARRNMLESNISTIHAFCSQVLREFPVEAGIDANFKVLEDFDASSLKEDACAEAVRDMLAAERPTQSSSGNRKVHDLLVKAGYPRVLALLVELLDNREKIEHARITGGPLVPDENVVGLHWRNMARTAADVIRLNVSSKKIDFQSESDALIESADEADTLVPLLLQLKGTLAKILTKEGTPRKRDIVIESGVKYSYEEAVSILQTPYSVLKDIDDGSIGIEMKDYVRTLETIVELYLQSEGNYSRKKFLMGALDFDDLQILTLRLLNGRESVRRTLGARFRHVMVDEFQDTNFLQYGIFLRLMEDFGSEARLFVVGDPKQSIYRFRNAQVEVSRTAGEKLSGLGDGMSMALSESFRMNADIAEFVNAIFPDVLRGSRAFDAAGLPSMSQTEYNALVPIRPQGEGESVEIFVNEKVTGNHSREDDAGGDTGSTEAQAEFTAARIREMVVSGEKIKTVKTGESPREISFGDIAILLRTRSRLSLLEGQLTKYGIPFVVSSGTGFYSAQEVYDLTNYLTFLLDNESDIALFTVLRSPLFGLSENELYGMSLAPGETLFDRFRSFSDSAGAGAEVRYAASVLAEETQLAQRETIPQLVNRILERTGWLGAYRMAPGSDQHLANLRKLLAIAREFEGRGFNSLYDFVERVKYLKETAREGQAPVEEASDAVKIMTVHAAKGLEFPVVFIPFCDSTARGRAGTIISEHVGVLPAMGEETPAALSFYKTLETMNEQAEIARLFYVACTRAMDKLVLTTSTKKTVGAVNTFTDVLVRSMDLKSVPAVEHIEVGKCSIRVHNAVPGVMPVSEEKVANDAEIGELFLDPVPADIDGEMYSATLLQTFRLCPTKYYLRYRLGMPAPDFQAARAGAGDRLDEYDDTILSTLKGQIVHSVLERVVRDGNMSDEAIDAASREVIVSGVDWSLTEKAGGELVKVVAENARNAAATLREIAGDGERFVEQTITRPFGSDFLTGTLDLLVGDEIGYHIYDYKTNRLDKPDEEIYAGYEIQMKLYALLCANMKTGQSEFDVTIIFTREPGRYIRRTYTKMDLTDFESELSGMLAKIKGTESSEGIFPSADSLPTVSPHCGECEYFTGKVRKSCLMSKK